MSLVLAYSVSAMFILAGVVLCIYNYKQVKDRPFLEALTFTLIGLALGSFTVNILKIISIQ